MIALLSRFVEWVKSITREDLCYWGYLAIMGIGTFTLWALAGITIGMLGILVGIVIWNVWPVIVILCVCVCAGIVIVVKEDSNGSIWSKKDGYDVFRKL